MFVRMKVEMAMVLLCLVTTSSSYMVAMKEKRGHRIVQFLESGAIVERGMVDPYMKPDLDVFCYKGVNKTLLRLFEKVKIYFEMEGGEYAYFISYQGPTPQNVLYQNSNLDKRIDSKPSTNLTHTFSMPSFEQSCIGIETVMHYCVHLEKQSFDRVAAFQITLGLTLLVFSDRISSTPRFYDIAGTILGTFSSFMLITWCFFTKFEEEPDIYGVPVGSWTIITYVSVLQIFWSTWLKMTTLFTDYITWFAVTGTASFVCCFGPATTRRGTCQNCVKFLLQLIALVSVYVASDYKEGTAGIAIVVTVLAELLFPRRSAQPPRWRQSHRFPGARHFTALRCPPPNRHSSQSHYSSTLLNSASLGRLLTREEYEEQGIFETEIAMDSLRAYAAGPDCNQWELLGRLRDPGRFARFVQGQDHVQFEETQNNETPFHFQHETDDSDVLVNEIL